MPGPMHISELYIYPLKSARGIPLREMPLADRGPAGDRRWMLIDERGVMLSQRDLPRMALIAVKNGAGHLSCSAPGMSPLRVPIPAAASASRITARVWDDDVDVQLAADSAHSWFSQFLGASCRLVHQPDDAFRQANRIYAAKGVGVSLADGFPLLLINQASLDDLNRRLERPVEMRRFRPNLVVVGAEPFAEDTWRTIRAGDLDLHLVKPCARCSIPAVDPDTGEMGKEPTRTLATFRRRNSDVFFGSNVVAPSSGTLRIGDPVTVLA
ncbi:MAG TPA: MOSC N-terminal beta barrel domain-containing protein [Candidatus Acidoferrales bacterium]|nr:MOSC N-terminal beta barrel domain-containing protein [Candidatus Acidoferrales bacterium]